MAGTSRRSYNFRIHNIPHYYGDYVRALFLVVAVVYAVAVPILGNLLPFSVLTQTGGVILLVLLAGLTNPHSPMVLLYDAIVAGLATLLLESAAISNYASQSLELFCAREAAGLLLLFAFYFSVKTLRAMSLGKLGKIERPWEFEDTNIQENE